MRPRLVLLFVAVTSMVVLAFVIPLAMLVRDVARDRAMNDANRDAGALFPVLAVTDDVVPMAIAISRTEAGSENRMAVHLPDGTVVGAELPPSDALMVAVSEGRASSGDVPGGAEVVAPVIKGDGSISVVRVFVPDADLTRGVRTAWLSLGAVGLVLVVGSVLLADRLARSVTRPVTALADASQRLGQGDLTTRVEPAGPPEIAEVGHAFNTLAGRVETLMHAEREDVADLAHRLRTPMAALRLQIDQVGKADVRAQLATSADDLARALDQVILLARRQGTEGPGECDLTTVVVERFDFWRALADEQGRPCQLVVDAEHAPIAVDSADLAAALDVIFDNIFAHTRDGTGYRTQVVEDSNGVSVIIEDDGPGFATPDSVERGASTASTGLGLDIARRIIQSGGGQLGINSATDAGARVEMYLPRLTSR